MASAGEPAHRDMASGAEPSHRHSPQDGAPRGIRRRAGARRVHDAAQDVSRDVQQDAHVQKEMEARALAVLVAGLEHPDSLPAPALQRSKRQRRSRVTSRGAGQGAQGPQSSRSTSAAASSSASSRGSFSRLSHSSLQSLVNRHESSQVGSDDQNHPHSSRAAVASSATCQGSFSSLHSLVNNCADQSDGGSLISSLVDRLDRVLKERDVGKSELERRGSEFLGIQTKEMMVLVAIVMFPPVALLAALAALLYLV